VIADRGYDSDPLRERWKRRGIELIAPYRNNNLERKYGVRRKLRRYKRRGKIGCTNAWLGQFRRFLVRHEHLFTIYLLPSRLSLDHPTRMFLKHALEILASSFPVPFQNALKRGETWGSLACLGHCLRLGRILSVLKLFDCEIQFERATPSVVQGGNI
jgi:hypothetical protein